jgi:hypothetical protein
MSGGTPGSSDSRTFIRSILQEAAYLGYDYLEDYGTSFVKRKAVEYLNQNKRMAPHRATQMASFRPVQYAARGHSRGYPKLKPCRPKVKISRKFKAKVDKAIAAHVATGTSTVYIMGNLLMNFSQNLQQASNNLYYGTTPSLITSTSAGTPTVSNPFEWFSQGGVLHAASVLFNSKPNDVCETITTLNLNDENLVIEIKYMSVSMTLHNTSQVTQELDFYQCIPKMSNSTVAVTDWTNSFTNANENLSAVNSAWYGVTPGMSSSFSKKWTYKKKTFLLKPGAKATHFVKCGPLCYKYANFQNVSTNWNYPKGVGMSCFFISKQPQILPNTAGHSAHNAHTTTINTTGFAAVTCELKSTYVIEAPELCEDTQKFDKFAYNAYVNNGAVVYAQTQVGATGDVVKDVFFKAPQVAAVVV